MNEEVKKTEEKKPEDALFYNWNTIPNWLFLNCGNRYGSCRAYRFIRR